MEKLLGASLSGEFWVTDNPNAKFEGVLAIDENGSATLSVEGDPRELMTLDTRPKFHMQGSAEGEEITLFDCFTTWVPLIPIEKKARIAVNIVAVGALIDSPETKVATALSFTTPEMIHWTDLRGVVVKQSKGQVAVKYRGKKTKEVQIGGATIQFLTGINYGSASRSELNLAERHGVRLVFDEPQSVLSIERWVTKTCRLVSLSLRCSTPCRLYALERERKGRITVVTPWSESKAAEARIRPLFTRHQMGTAYARLLRGWFTKYDTLEPIISLRVALLAHPAKFREFEFLTYLQALEALHRRTSPARTIVNKAKFSALRHKFTDAIPDRWPSKPEFVSKLNYLNEVSLAARLKELFAQDDQLLSKLFRDTKADIALIRDIRNYFTHYDARKKRDIRAYTATAKFWYLTSKVELLLEIGILRAIGFSRAAACKVVEQNSAYRDLCKVDHSP